MNMYPISVVMSVYNASPYLTEAIESILSQTFTEFEFIIINDGSTDKSTDIVQSFSDKRIKLVNQQNTGLAIALNHGIELANSNLIARMDADDICMPDRLEKQYNFLKENIDYILVGSNAEIIDKDGNYVFTSSQKLSDKAIRTIFPNSPFFHPSVMFRKEYFYKVGEYSINMYTAQDLVLFYRMAKMGKIANLKESLIKYRIVPSANSIRDSKTSSRFNAILAKAIKHNKISKEDSSYLKELISNRNSKLRLANYHLYIAKKYLWNNYHSKLARKNLIESLKIRFNILSFFYYFVSFLPEKTIKKLYQILK